MKKIIFVSACLLMTLVTFAEGKPAFEKKSVPVIQQKKTSARPPDTRTVVSCGHTSEMAAITYAAHNIAWNFDETLLESHVEWTPMGNYCITVTFVCIGV